MSTGGGGVSDVRERSLNRKSSKSRLEKQHEVEDEDPPGGRGASRDGSASARTTAELERASIALANDSMSTGAATTGATVECQETSLSKMLIPETRVESFDIVEAEDDDKSAPAKSKVLVRSHAMCGDDDTKLNARAIEKQGSKSSAGSSLSRDSSNELYTDSTGINLEEFIINTLHKNPRDRTFLLDLEQTLIRFIQDSGKQIHRFPTMSSYNRMLVHRVAAFFGLDHNVDQSGQAVVVSKMQTTRIPDVPFRDYIKHDIFTDEPKKVLLKRDVQSYEETQVRTSDQPFDIRKARSFEEREEEYVRVRARIFNQQDSSSSVEGVIESPVRPWSSTDSSSDQSQVSFMQIQRAQLMQKAGSFGGMPTFYRSDATKVSPRRSNTESNRDVVGFPRQPTIPEASSGPSSPPIIPAGQSVIFAVANIEQVPPGAIIINAQTGQPYLNPDGSVYRHGLLPPRPLSAAPHTAPTTFPAPPPSAMLPFCGTPLSADLSASITGQLQQLNLMQPAAVGVPSDPARPALAPPQVYFGAPQVYTYVVSQQQQSQPQQSQSQASESSPQRLPPISSQPTILPQSPSAGFMQPVSVQYQESMSYAVHTGQIPCTQAPSQGTVTLASSPVGYPIYYAPHAPPVAGQPLMVAPGIPFPTQQHPLRWSDVSEGLSAQFATEQCATSPKPEFLHAGAGAGYQTPCCSGDNATACSGASQIAMPASGCDSSTSGAAP